MHLQVQVQQAAPSLLSLLPFLALIVCPQPKPGQIRAPNPKHFRQAQPAPTPAPAPAPAPPSCRSGCQFTHAFIRTHSRPFPLLPLPISLTHPGLPPATPQLIPYSTPKSSHSFLATPRNQNNSCHKQPPAARRKIKSSCQTLTQHDFRARNSFAPRSFRTLLLSLVPVSRKLISFREAFASSRRAVFLLALRRQLHSPLRRRRLCCGVTQRSASHRIGLGRPFLQLATSSSLRRHAVQADAWGSDHPTHPSPDPHPSLQPRSTLVN